MLAIKGNLYNGHFIPHDEITLPKQAEVVIYFIGNIQSSISNDEETFWEEFDRMAIESIDENILLDDEAFTRRDSGRDIRDFFNESLTP